jgi:hypothetical protein
MTTTEKYKAQLARVHKQLQATESPENARLWDARHRLIAKAFHTSDLDLFATALFEWAMAAHPNAAADAATFDNCPEYDVITDYHLLLTDKLNRHMEELEAE